jgi:hypothetical protein
MNVPKRASAANAELTQGNAPGHHEVIEVPGVLRVAADRRTLLLTAASTGSVRRGTFPASDGVRRDWKRSGC